MNLRVFLEWMETFHHCLDGDRIRAAFNLTRIDDTLIRGIWLIDNDLPTPEQDRIDLRDYVDKLCLYINENPAQPTEPTRIGIDVIQRLIAELPPET